MSVTEIQKIVEDKFAGKPLAINHFNELLKPYFESQLAPPNMISQLASNDGSFWSHIWEALLYGHLKSLNFEFVKGMVKKSGQRGPDFGIIYAGQIIWLGAKSPVILFNPKFGCSIIKLGTYNVWPNPAKDQHND